MHASFLASIYNVLCVTDEVGVIKLVLSNASTMPGSSCACCPHDLQPDHTTPSMLYVVVNCIARSQLRNITMSS